MKTTSRWDRPSKADPPIPVSVTPEKKSVSLEDLPPPPGLSALSNDGSPPLISVHPTTPPKILASGVRPIWSSPPKVPLSPATAQTVITEDLSITSLPSLMEESNEDSDHGSHSLWSHVNFSQEFLDFLADDSITYYPGHTAKTDPYFRDSTAPMSAFRNDIANCTLAPIDYRTEPPLNYEYDSGFRQCANNENVICLKLTVPVKGKGSRINSLVVDKLVYRSTKTMIIRALHSMTINGNCSK